MNKTQKFIGLLAILPLALVTLSPVFIGDGDAANVGSQDVISRPGYQPDKVCGDRLCSDSASASVILVESSTTNRIEEFQNDEIILSNGTIDDNETESDQMVDEIVANLWRISIKYTEIYGDGS